MNILDAMNDPELFGKSFRRGLLRGDTWRAWKAFLCGLFGLEMSTEAVEILQRHTGREWMDGGDPLREAYVIAGRRSGKSVIAALVAVFLACFKSYDELLSPGEVGTLMVIAADRRQARVIFAYISAFLEAPILKAMVVSRLKESITLINRVAIEIHTCSFRATRGYTLIGVVADELAFWNSEESANPDTEVLNALRPGLATTNGLLLGISSPHAKRGALYNAYREHYGKPSDVLVWKAASREMNPSLSAAVVAAAYVRDKHVARAEYGGEFRDDIASFVSPEDVAVVTISGRRELPCVVGFTYKAFVDASGGRSDSMTLAIAHSEGEKAVLDLTREIPAPFVPETVVKEFADTLKRYRIFSVVGDRYGAEWVASTFSQNGIRYDASPKNRSEIYLEFLPAMMSRQIELLDDTRLAMQFANLERRASHLGRESVDHAPGSHDDLANAAAGALIQVVPGRVLTLGLVEWYEKQFESTRIAPSLVSDATVAEAQQAGCPRCGKTLIQKVQGGQHLRCAACGHEFAGRVIEPSPGRRWLFDESNLAAKFCGVSRPRHNVR